MENENFNSIPLLCPPHIVWSAARVWVPKTQIPTERLVVVGRNNNPSEPQPPQPSPVAPVLLQFDASGGCEQATCTTT